VQTVSQLLDSEGFILNYEEFLCKFNFPVTPKEFSIVMDALDDTFPLLDPFEHPIEKLCFLSNKSSLNIRIRSLFQKELVTIPYVASYWMNLFDHIDWKKVWTLPLKCIITNKIREISFKLLHKCYPAKAFLKRFKSDL